MSLSQVAQRLGYEQAHQLKYHFPEECQLVTQRARDYRKQRQSQRFVRVREEVRQAVISLHNQGCYPTQRKVGMLLSQPNLMLVPEVRQASPENEG